MLIIHLMLSTESLLLLRSIALTGQDSAMVFSLQELLLWILVNDVLLIAAISGAFIGIFAAVSMPEKDDN